MRLLLDTHIWIWSMLEPSRLGRKTRKALADGDNEFWLSPVSTWELTMLVKKGRIKLDRVGSRRENDSVKINVTVAHDGIAAVRESPAWGFHERARFCSTSRARAGGHASAGPGVRAGAPRVRDGHRPVRTGSGRPGT